MVVMGMMSKAFFVFGCLGDLFRCRKLRCAVVEVGGLLMVLCFVGVAHSVMMIPFIVG